MTDSAASIETASEPPAPEASSIAPAPPDRSIRRTLRLAATEVADWFKTLASAAVYATLIVTFVGQVARVDGSSMLPTLHNNDRLIVNKLAYRWHRPQIGDIVMVASPDEPDRMLVKRIVAGPGDIVRSEDGRVYRNDTPIHDEFVPEMYRSIDTWGPEVVPRGYYFVMGDHRNNSSDSRLFGPVPERYIVGRIQVRWWPVPDARVF
jgi:signal peptidase I